MVCILVGPDLLGVAGGCIVGLPSGSEGGIKASSLGLDGASSAGEAGLRGLGGGGKVLPSMTSGLGAAGEGDLVLTLACRSFSLIRSATVPVRRRLALANLGDAV
jgi:hypothetical protein